MQLKIVLAFIMLSAVVAYPYQILPWQEAKKTWNKIVNRNLKVMAKSTHIDWCPYWNAIGVQKPECIPRERYRPAPAIPLIRDVILARISTLTPSCQSRFLLATCTANSRCRTGKLCIDTTHVECCLPPPDECPTTVQLGFKCVVRSPVNWCTHNGDCGGRKCCPTGCNYNVCV